MKYRIILLLALCSFSKLAHSQVKRINQLDSLFTSLHHSGEFSGSVLVAEHGKVLYEKGFGLADEETKKPINVETVFELASVSKQFTAMGIVQLKKEGKLLYDDLMSKYIPELKNYGGVTIQNLLTHTGGLPDYMQLMTAAKQDKKSSITNNAIIKFFEERQPPKEFEPGEKFEYSNTGYILLATIIERVSGKSFEGYLKEKIFGPLGLKNTFVYRRRYQPKEIKNYALGYLYSDSLKRKILPDAGGKDSYYVYLDGMFGDGMINSNLHDLLKWDRALYPNKIINDEDRKVIFSSHKIKDTVETGYGFGWFVRKESEYGKIVGHTGRWAGYLTLIERDTDNGKTIIILENNETKITEDIRLVGSNARKILYGQPIEKPLVLPDELLKRYAGDYRYENGKDTKIYYEFSRLWTNNQYQLKPVTDTQFTVIGFRPEVTYEFLFNSNKEVEKIRIQQPNQGIDQIAIRKNNKK